MCINQYAPTWNILLCFSYGLPLAKLFYIKSWQNRPQVLLPHNLYVDFLHMKRHGLWNLNCTKIRCLSNHFSETGLNSNLHQLLLYFFIQLHNLLPNSRIKLNFRKHTTEVLSYGCVRPIYMYITICFLTLYCNVLEKMR